MKFIAITGGPGAGKTAVLEMARRTLCEHVAVLPEAAGIIFGGGFPRRRSDPALRAAQRAIYHVQREMEFLFEREDDHLVALCDRGTLDGLAYWPGTREEYFESVKSTMQAELVRYDAVIHLRVPGLEQGYNNSNVLRSETADEARVIDERILDVWRDHPHRHIIDSRESFMAKAQDAMSLIHDHLPNDCCL